MIQRIQRIDFNALGRNAARSILTWAWTKKLLTWLIISAGTMSECVFVGASLWICINASVHSFVLLFMSDTTSRMLTSLADTAYVGLPELILPLAIVTTISHFRLWFSQKRSVQPLIWLCMFGLPTLVFLSISIATLGFSLASVGFELPLPFVIVRGISGYWYAIASILYIKLGEPQERDRLQEKDNTIAALRRESEINLSTLRQEHTVNLALVTSEKQKLTELVENLKAEMSESKKLLEQSINAHTRLAKEIDKSNQPALDAYSQELQNWLTQGHKSISIEDIIRLTGHHKRTVSNAIANKALLTTSRNKELIMTDSFVSWLQSKPLPSTNENNDGRQLRLVNE